MSNSIWHKYDIKDIPNPHHEILAWTGTKHAVVIIKQAEWRSGDCDWIESWAYIQDVLAQADKAELLQKAVDYALQVLDNVSEIGGIDMEMIKIERMIKETTNDK